MFEAAGLEMTSGSNTSGSTEKLARQLEDIKKACVIIAEDETEDSELVRDLERMGLSVQFCNTSQIELLRNDIRTIIVQDFSSFLETRDPVLLYYGPTCIKREASESSDSKKPQLPFTGHSMLTSLLLNHKCCLQVARKSQSKVRAQIYALGGRLSKKVHEANLLITSYASGDPYKLAQNFRIPVVTPAFIDALWEWRESLDFKVTQEFVEKYRLSVFSRLKMHFFGFESSRKDELSQRATANGALIVGQVSRNGTYIVVVNRDRCSMEELQKLDRELSPESTIVYEEWFHDSIAEGYALCEKQEKFNARRAAVLANGRAVCSPLGRRKRGADASPGMTPKSKKSMESLLLSPRVEELSRLDSCSGALSPAAGAASPIRTEQITDKRHLILLELLNTEVNYLNVLQFIMRMVRDLLGGLDSDRKASRTNQTQSSQQSHQNSQGSQHPAKEPDEIITRFEKQEIFKEIPSIIALHEVLKQRIEDALNTMDFKNIAAIFHGEDACGLIPDPESSGKTIKRRASRKVQDKGVKDNNIVAAYETFLNGMETIVHRVKTLTAENPRFAEFVKAVEEQRECKREKFLDLLIRPVQRLPSIVNILKSYTEESEKLARKLEERCSAAKDDPQLQKEVAQIRFGAQDAYRVRCFIELSLKEMNESKYKNARICEALITQSGIEDLPPIPWSKDNTLSYQCDATLIGVSESYPQAPGQKSLKNVEVVCFMFSHGLEIARKKIGKTHKPHKHVSFIHFEKMNAIIDSLDPSFRRYLEFVFREQRKSYSIPQAEADTTSLGGGSDLAAAEFSEERILLDLKDVANKDGLLKRMNEECETFALIERISMPAIPDRKESLRTDSLLLNLSSGAHGTTPVTQLARSLSNVPEMSTPKKLTRSFSNLFKGFKGNKQREEQSASSSPSNSTTLSRSRQTALPRCMSSSCASSSSDSSTNSKYRFLSSLSPLNRRMDLLVLNTLSSVMPSATSTSAAASATTYNFNSESNRHHKNNNCHTENYNRKTSNTSIESSLTSPVKLKAISSTLSEISPHVTVVTPEPALPMASSNTNNSQNNNKTKNTLNNNTAHKNNSEIKEKKKSKRKSSNF